MKKNFKILALIIIIFLMDISLLACNTETNTCIDANNDDICDVCGLIFSLEEDGSYAVTGYRHDVLENLIIPSSFKEKTVTSIGSSAFYDCIRLESVVIPDSVTSIGEEAFSGCGGLTSVEIGNSVTSIGDSAFYDCNSLESVVIPDFVTSIGNGAFYWCSSLTSVEIGNSVTSIGSYAFYRCDSLTSVVIPDSVTSIGEEAFSGCGGLTSIVIGNSVTSIGDEAFYYCRSLTSVVIGDSVTSIGNGAFYWCNITSVYYSGTETEWRKLSNSSYYNIELDYATRYYYSETEPTEEGNYWHYVDGIVTVW